MTAEGVEETPRCVCLVHGRAGWRSLRAPRAAALGSTLVAEDPLLFVPSDPSAAILGAPGGLALLEAGRALGDVRLLGPYAAYSALDLARRRTVDRFRGERRAMPAKVARQGVAQLLAADPALEAAADWAEVLRLHGVMVSNAVQLKDGSLALFEHIAAGNHSCDPNSEIVSAAALGPGWRGHPMGAALRATRAIGAGEEVTYSYVPSLMLRARARDRRDFILVHRGFECRCAHCLARPRRLALRRRLWPGSLRRGLPRGPPGASAPRSLGLEVRYFRGCDELDVEVVAR